jgi:hypothetical protein
MLESRRRSVSWNRRTFSAFRWPRRNEQNGYPGRRHLSFSSISMYQGCALRRYFRYVEGCPTSQRRQAWYSGRPSTPPCSGISLAACWRRRRRLPRHRAAARPNRSRDAPGGATRAPEPATGRVHRGARFARRVLQTTKAIAQQSEMRSNVRITASQREAIERERLRRGT